MAVLQTKLFIPLASEVELARVRLLEQIDFSKRLTLISAPAGFGKTTLVAQSITAQAGWLACWVSLDTADNDLLRFFNYLIATLQKVNQQIGRTLLPTLKTRPPFAIILTALINDVVQTDDNIVLVLDDYHLITNPQIHAALTFLLDHLPPQWHVIITTRADPPLPIARLRARGQLTELRAADIRFTLTESDQFLNGRMQLELSPADIKQLDSRTEGWIVGLQLAALSLQPKGAQRHAAIANFSGDNRYVMDYLVNDVLAHLAPEVQQFLYQTAILKRLCASLCNAVCEITESQRFLHELEQLNLFLFPL